MVDAILEKSWSLGVADPRVFIRSGAPKDSSLAGKVLYAQKPAFMFKQF
jgi:hypothetical protein